MKILKVIHGYPPLYNAGSEVYSQTLCRELAKEHDVQVFTREENPFSNDFSIRTIYDNDGMVNIKINLVNIPTERYRYTYRSDELNNIFQNLIEEFLPDIIHIGHLNHLAISLVDVAAKMKTPIIYTLHDFWLMCPRGQFLHRNAGEPFALCTGQDDSKCASQCFIGYCSSKTNSEPEIAYWTTWVANRMEYVRNACKKINYFIAPSKQLRKKYIHEFKLNPKKVLYSDYGFDLKRFEKRHRIEDEPFTFGYIGTHIPAKGINLLLRAFSEVKGNCQLRIWGRPSGQNTAALKKMVASFPDDIRTRITWLPEYNNEKIVTDVFIRVDCIVVPSIWLENSPLVIHEALQCRVPVITANVGGMSEYVHHEQNGLLFKHRDSQSLAEQMQRFTHNTRFAKKLGHRGYLQSQNGNIISIEDEARFFENLYQTILTQDECILHED